MKRLRHGDNRRGVKAPEYSSWRSIKKRCLDPAAKGYKYYGGRGIGVCPEWADRHGYAAFLAHIGRQPTPMHTVERIDNSRGYESGNVRWATPKEQGRNKRNNRMLTLDGVTLCLSAWADRTGITSLTIRARLRDGWTVERALTTATAPGGGRFTSGNRSNRYCEPHIEHAPLPEKQIAR